MSGNGGAGANWHSLTNKVSAYIRFKTTPPLEVPDGSSVCDVHRVALENAIRESLVKVPEDVLRELHSRLMDDLEEAAGDDPDFGVQARLEKPSSWISKESKDGNENYKILLTECMLLKRDKLTFLRRDNLEAALQLNQEQPEIKRTTFDLKAEKGRYRR